MQQPNNGYFPKYYPKFEREAEPLRYKSAQLQPPQVLYLILHRLGPGPTGQRLQAFTKRAHLAS